MSPDCVIVGGGLLGMLTARELALAGARVRIVERNRLGREASWAGGGILSPLYPWQQPDAVNRLAAWSQAAWPRLAGALQEETGRDCQWLESGLLLLDGAERADAEAWAARFDAELAVLEGTAVGDCEPGLGAPPPLALWMPRVAQVRNPRLLQALAESLRLHGVEIQEGVAVTDLLASGSRVDGVDSTAGRITAGRVVVAGGAWSAGLLAHLGLSIPVQPVRGQMILFRAVPGLVRHIVLANKRYLVPRADGRVLAGSTLEYAGFDKTTTEAARAELQAAAVNLIPALAGYAVEQHWAGLRPGSPTGVPLIGPVPQINNLYLNAGHFRNGVVLAPGSARLVADLILERPPVLDPAPYRPEGVVEPVSP